MTRMNKPQMTQMARMDLGVRGSWNCAVETQPTSADALNLAAKMMCSCVARLAVIYLRHL